MYGLAVAPLVGCVLALGGVAGPLGLAKTLAALCAVSAAASALLTVATAEWAVAACGSVAGLAWGVFPLITADLAQRVPREQQGQ